jgi:hypothetical protein
MSRYILIRRLRWPAILLLIGVLALLHQAGAVTYFWRLFWPLLLIMIGVLLLAERAALAAEGDAPLFGAPWQGPPQPGAGIPGAGPGVQQSAGLTGTAIMPSQPHDFENDVNGGQR